MVPVISVNINRLRSSNHSINERSYVLNSVNVFDTPISSVDTTGLKLKEI